MAGLVAGIVAVFAPVWWFDFINFDDPVYVLLNPIVAEGVTWSGIVRAFTTTQAAYWHPLTWLSHMLDVELYALAAGPHHMMNVLLHGLSTVLLFGILSRMTGTPGRSAVVAAIFAIHPLRLESVVWVAERKDVLSTFFWMLTLWAYVEYAQKPARGRYVAIVVLFALGLLAKPMVLTLPIVLCLLDVWPLRRIELHDLLSTADPDNRVTARTNAIALLREKVPLAILAVIAAGTTFWAQHGGGAVKGLDMFPLDHRVANAIVSYVTYLWMMVWPLKLAVFYPHVAAIPPWQVIVSLLVLAAITWMAFRLVRQFPFILVGWLWYLATLVPVIGLVQAGLQKLADRFTYLPHIGISIAVVWGVSEVSRRWRWRAVALPAMAAIAIGFFAIAARAQVGYWRDSETLWRRALEVTSGNYMAHHNLGVVLTAQGHFDQALANLQEALRIWPEFAEAHNSIGNVKAKQGDDRAAAEHYRDALRLAPSFAAAHNNLGLALTRLGATQDAIAHYGEALRLLPDFAAAHHNLGRALLAQGHRDQAEAKYREAIRLRPMYAEAHFSLGELLADGGHRDEAVMHLREAVRLDPRHEKAQWALAALKSRDGG